jgi:hypothetical protein
MLGPFLLLLAWSALAPSGDRPTPPAPVADDVVEWSGRAVCVDESGGRVDCAPEGNRFALYTSDGKLHWFAPHDPLAPVFDDPRVRDQPVVVRVRPHPDGTGELIKVYSVKHGKRHDVRYFCEVCNVTSFVYQLCPCCRGEMELQETPVE